MKRKYMLVGQIGQFAPMDEKSTDLFRQLMKKMMEQARKLIDEISVSQGEIVNVNLKRKYRIS